MQGVTLNPVLLPLPRSRAGNEQTGRGQTSRETAASGQAPNRPDYRFDPARQAQLSDSLRRYVHYTDEQQAGGRRETLSLRGQRALDAYVGTRRDEEKTFLHETLGIDSYA